MSIPRPWPITRSLFVFALAVALLAAIRAESQVSPFSMTTPRNIDLDRWALEGLCNAAGDHCSEARIKKYGFRMSRYRPGLRRGEHVRPYASGPSMPDLQCWNRCSLYFLDLMPGAHFAHPTVIGLYDRVTGDLQTAVGEMWPVINGERHVLDTVRTRVRSSVEEQPGQFGLPEVKKGRTPAVIRPEISIVRPVPDPAVLAMLTPPECKVHAVVVNGYMDEDDTFDDDAKGMYEVLRGLGLSDDRIVLVSPLQSPLRDYSVSPTNLENAIDFVAQSVTTSSCDEFLFFLSTHGTNLPLDEADPYIFELRDSPGNHHWVLGDDLADWLSRVKCKKVTVVVEACKSGRLVELISEAMDSAGTPVRMFLSAGHESESWGDIDEGDLNPEDVGSETIWGYIEAIGTSEADLSPIGVGKGRVSFEEAATYAINKDITTRPGRIATVVNFDPALDSSPHSCCIFGVDADLSISPCSLLTKRRKSVDIYGMSQVVPRCTNTPIWITIHNRGMSTIPVGTLRLYGSVLAQDEVLPTSLSAYANVVLVTDLQPGERRTYKVRWGVRPSFRKGDRVALFALIDSPLDPVGADLCIQSGPGPEACQADQQSCLCEVSVIKRCFPISGCNCKTYAPPEPPEE